MADEELSFSPQYRDKTVFLAKAVCGELCSIFLMLIILNFMLLSPLWDKVYVETIKQDWNTSPLIEVVLQDAGQDCDDGYENIAKAYWWGLKGGCSCNGATYAAAKLEVCTDEELAAYCYTTKKREPKWLDVINGKNICGKRAKVYNFLNMKKPKKYVQAKEGEGQPVECKDPKYKVCGDADTSVEVSQVWCILKEQPCPITKIEFEGTGEQMKVKTDDKAIHGEPLVDLQMSQGGAPCIHYRTSHNAWSPQNDQVKKKYYRMFPDAYYQACEEIKIGDQKFNSSDQIFTNVTSFAAVSEKQLLQENLKSTDYNDIFSRWITFATNNDMNQYLYYMYSKSYLEWHQCTLPTIQSIDGEYEVTAKEMLDVFEKADSISYNAQWFYSLTQYNMIIVFCEVFVVLAHFNEALPFKQYNIIMIVRRVLSLLLIIFSIYNFVKMMTWYGGGRLVALASDQAEKCHNDPALDNTFDQMLAYVGSIQSGVKPFFLVLFFLMVFGAMVFTSFIKFVQCDKIYKNPDQDDNYEKTKEE